MVEEDFSSSQVGGLGAACVNCQKLERQTMMLDGIKEK
jgi:hypothetical protein